MAVLRIDPFIEAKSKIFKYMAGIESYINTLSISNYNTKKAKLLIEIQLLISELKSLKKKSSSSKSQIETEIARWQRIQDDIKNLNPLNLVDIKVKLMTFIKCIKNEQFKRFQAAA